MAHTRLGRNRSGPYGLIFTMSITTTISTPTTESIKCKNSKEQLARCALNIFHKIDECKDLDFKKRVLEDLFLVL